MKSELISNNEVAGTGERERDIDVAILLGRSLIPTLQSKSRGERNIPSAIYSPSVLRIIHTHLRQFARAGGPS